MGIDLNALKARLAAKADNSSGGSNGTSNKSTQASTANVVPATNSTVVPAETVANSTNVSTPVPAAVNAPAKLGTSKTTEIEHLDFLAKMNSLADAIHKQHPTMPVLLMQIHKQLRADPELVSTLDEDAIGIIVKGLQVQTKTELVAEAVKKTTGRTKKNAALSTDMF